MAELPAEQADQPQAGDLATTKKKLYICLKLSYKYTNYFYF